MHAALTFSVADNDQQFTVRLGPEDGEQALSAAGGAVGLLVMAVDDVADHAAKLGRRLRCRQVGQALAKGRRAVGGLGGAQGYYRAFGQRWLRLQITAAAHLCEGRRAAGGGQGLAKEVRFRV